MSWLAVLRRLGIPDSTTKPKYYAGAIFIIADRDRIITRIVEGSRGRGDRYCITAFGHAYREMHGDEETISEAIASNRNDLVVQCKTDKFRRAMQRLLGTVPNASGRSVSGPALLRIDSKSIPIAVEVSYGTVTDFRPSAGDISISVEPFTSPEAVLRASELDHRTFHTVMTASMGRELGLSGLYYYSYLDGEPDALSVVANIDRNRKGEDVGEILAKGLVSAAQRVGTGVAVYVQPPLEEFGDGNNIPTRLYVANPTGVRDAIALACSDGVVVRVTLSSNSPHSSSLDATLETMRSKRSK